MSKVVKVFPDRLPPFFLPRLVGRNGFLLRRDTSSSKIHCCYIIISTELKEKHTLEQDALFCCIIISSRLQDNSVSSVAQLYLALCYPMNRSMPGLPVHHQHLEFTQTKSIESVMPSSHLILCRPLLLLPPIPPSIRLFSNEPTLLMRWPNYWSISFSIIPSKEIPGLISFRMD